MEKLNALENKIKFLYFMLMFQLNDVPTTKKFLELTNWGLIKNSSIFFTKKTDYSNKIMNSQVVKKG